MECPELEIIVFPEDVILNKEIKVSYNIYISKPIEKSKLISFIFKRIGLK